MLAGKLLKLIGFIAGLFISVFMVITICGVFFATVSALYFVSMATLVKGAVALLYFLTITALIGFAVVKMSGVFHRLSFIWSGLHTFFFVFVFLLVWLVIPEKAASYLQWEDVQHMGIWAYLYLPFANSLTWAANMVDSLFFQIRPIILYLSAICSIIFCLIMGLSFRFSKRKIYEMKARNENQAIETDRLRLRMFNLKDLDEMAKVLSHPDVMKFSLTGPLSQIKTREFLEKCIYQYQNGGYAPFAIEHKENRKVIGYCGFTSQEIEGVKEVEIGYRLNPVYWNRGLATEAALAFKKYGLEVLALPKLISIIEPDNKASIKVAIKVGMKLEKETLFKGKVPVLIYSVENEFL